MNKPEFANLLKSALTEPGKLSTAYRAFHNFSPLNQLLALEQMIARGIEVSPIASFSAWKNKNRMVKKGEKAISLFMPLQSKGEVEDTKTGETETRINTFFALKPHWFALSQTQGEEVQIPGVPGWDRTQAIAVLGVTEIPFAHTNGNCQGYALEKTIAVNPLAAYPLKTTIHELAHVVLGHTLEGQLDDNEVTPRSLREVEAEGVAFIVCATLGLDGLESSRAYIQGWLDGQELNDKNAARIFGCADKILKAGKPQIQS